MEEPARIREPHGIRIDRLVRSANPGRVALLWFVSTALLVFSIVLFPDRMIGSVSSVLYMAGTQVFAGLLAGWALRLRGSVIGLIELMLRIILLYIVVGLTISFLLAPQEETNGQGSWAAMVPLLLCCSALWGLYRRRSKWRRVAAIFLFMGANFAASWFAQSDNYFWRLSSTARTRFHLVKPEPNNDRYDAMRDILPDHLWEAQSGLLDHQVDGLSPRSAGQTNVHAIGVAAGGVQDLFGREAHLALKVAAAHFVGSYRGGLLLSNALPDILHTPLATQGNMLAAAQKTGRGFDPARDIAFVYLASHGSAEAWLETDLPNYTDLTPISARSVADALARAGIKRRIVVISACYSGSWIPALASDDTIVITAARKDRTSFGCDDTRRLTFFGQAFLEGPLARGASLKDAFDSARRTVSAWERRDKLTPSEPQVYVGRNMQAIWTATAAATSTAR